MRVLCRFILGSLFWMRVLVRLILGSTLWMRVLVRFILGSACFGYRFTFGKLGEGV